MPHVEGRPEPCGAAGEHGAHSHGLGGMTPRGITENQEEAGAPFRVMSGPLLLAPNRLAPSQDPREKTRVGWAWGEGGRIPAGRRSSAPSHVLVPGLCPSQEMWRSSFLHHGNRCSCFHWPGASLMLLAVLLLLGCCGSQPAGRYPLPPRGLGLPLSCLSSVCRPTRDILGEVGCPHSRLLSC